MELVASVHPSVYVCVSEFPTSPVWTLIFWHEGRPWPWLGWNCRSRSCFKSLLPCCKVRAKVTSQRSRSMFQGAAIDIRGSALPSEAKSSSHHYQPKVFVCNQWCVDNCTDAASWLSINLYFQYVSILLFIYIYPVTAQAHYHKDGHKMCAVARSNHEWSLWVE